ncbi:MAG: tetratricopeptide repeat protein [Candidatus Omnitrophica bacterium]|nr:tetratricopeptide repeat protein [Candidatus Omnitrophota bacterium]
MSFPSLLVSAPGLRDQALAHRQEGYQHQQQGDIGSALAAYQKAAELDPGYAAARVDVGVMLEQMGRLEDAQGAYESALLVDPRCREAHSNLANLHERLGQTEQAVAHWRQRYALGEAGDSWTVKARERLVALGALPADAPAAPVMSTDTTGNPAFAQRAPVSGSGQVAQREFEAYEQSLQDYRSLTGHVIE